MDLERSRWDSGWQVVYFQFANQYDHPKRYPKASSTSQFLGVSVEHTEELDVFTVDIANLLLVAYQSKLQLLGVLCGFLRLCRE